MRARVAALLALAATGAAAQTTSAPPNAPAALETRGDSVFLKYDGVVVLAAQVRAEHGTPAVRHLTEGKRGPVTQIVAFLPGKGRIQLSGTITAPGDAFAVEADPREDGLPIVRNADGPVANLLNRAVYARDRDWLLSVDHPAGATIAPMGGHFSITATGAEITMRFRPRFYQQHRGLAAYEPWTYKSWPVSVAGWTSWFAFKDRVTENDVHRAADVVAAQLAPYGYSVIQIDDGFQQNPIGVPEHWLTTNAKFPNGLAGLQKYIAGRGLTAGLWTNTTFHDSTWAAQHPKYFVRDRDGKPVRGNWVGWVMDGSNPATLRDLVDPVYTGLKSQGWNYFKVDALRHLRYEGYNANHAWFSKHRLDRTVVYRDFVKRIRDDIGRESFLLASWGPRPELIGLIDATRLGDDGFGYGGFAQYNSFNNVVWRNDPDHIEIHQPDGFRAATLASLTGALVMLTDKPQVYETARVEAARRAVPVPVTRPGQVYDVDPSRSRLLAQTLTEVSGAGPRPFEADQRLQQTLYQLDVARPFDKWTVLARTEGAPSVIDLDDLGLRRDATWIAFDFWNRRAVGAFTGSISTGPVDTLGVQVLCLREAVNRPQLLATSRHVACGTELSDLNWFGDALFGSSQVVANDPYDLWISEPEGFTATTVTADGVTARLGALQNVHGVRWRTVHLHATTSRTVNWRITYDHR